jgi:succinate-acetate transporter protein
MTGPAMSEGSDVATSGPEPAPAAPVANAVPLGILSFAVVTFIVSYVSAGLINSAVIPVLFGAALTTGGIAHFICGTVELRNGNTFTGCLFNGYGGFWMSYWALNQFFLKDIPPAQAGHAVGLYLLVWCVFTVCFFIPALALPKAITATLGCLVLTFLLLGIGNAGAHTDVIHAGGGFGIATAAGAAYVGLSQLITATFGRDLLPLF